MTWRPRFIFSLFIIGIFLVLARLLYWQVIKAEELSSLGLSQYGRSVILSSERGEIKSSDGFPIATESISYLIFANPKEIVDKESTANILSSNLNIDKASISAWLSENRYWVPLQRNVTEETNKKITKLNLKGIYHDQEYKRYYPEASMAATLLGFVGKDEAGEDKGYFGLEGYYDRQLKGKSRTIIQIFDALGKPIFSKLEKNIIGASGRTLILNIDRVAQFIAEKHLKESIERYKAAGGMVVVMEPTTGKILAMASFPSFDPGNYKDFPEELYKNPLISSTFEPGSTFKPLVMASALDSKVVKPDTQCSICSGPVPIGEYQIKTWNNQYKARISMTEVIQRSDNTGMVFVAQSIGLDKIFSYFKKFGIGELTGIDLQGEVAPLIRPKEEWYPIDLATAGFGQGISITPIALLVGFSSLANEGIRMEPHIVAQIQTTQGDLIDIKPKVLGRTVSSQVAKIVTEMLVNAVNKGEAKWTKVKGYRIAGKTGTAQIPIAGHYDPNKTITSFIGFAPADDPKFAMLVIVDRPTTSIYGAETAAPIFMDIAKDLLLYYGIPPTE